MRRVLVTGASRGIGAAIALELGQAGFEVTVHYHRDRTGAERTLAGLGRGRLLACDVADAAACRARLEEDIAAHGAYYGVVCNAGLAVDRAFAMMDEEDWAAVIRTNLDGFYNVIRPLLMPMIALHEGGRIVTLSSASGQAGNRGQVNYAAAKAGVIGASKALALELARRGITVNCVAPGLIDTAMADALDGRVREEILRQIPMRRLGSPAEVAATVGFLFSEGAAYITRQVIGVNGGLI